MLRGVLVLTPAAKLRMSTIEEQEQTETICLNSLTSEFKFINQATTMSEIVTIQVLGQSP